MFQYDGSGYNFSAMLAGPVRTTPGALYVWGINRGQGTARFSPALPGTDNVLFDAVVVLNPNGASFVQDLLTSTATSIAPGQVSFVGNSLFAFVGAGLLPSTGFAPSAYTANLWPRVGLGNVNQIADFAPDNRNITVATVPEPATFVLLVPAAAAILLMRRRRGRR